MKLNLTIASCVLFLVAPVLAERFIVTRNGEGIWATSAKREGSRIVYTDKNTGAEKSIADDELEAVIPSVRRGKDYKTEEINKYIERIQKAKRKHGRLKRPLTSLLNDWNALLRPVTDLGGDIEALVASFMTGERSIVAHKKANMELGMLGYKDQRGRFAGQIEKAQASIRDAYIAYDMDRLLELTKKEEISLDAYAHIKEIRENLRSVVKGHELADLDATIEKARLAALRGNYLKTKRIVSGKEAGLDRCLAAIGALRRMKSQVASGEDETQALARLEAQIRQKMPGAFADYRFDKDGYPVHASDKALRKKMRGASRAVKFQSIEVDEQCSVIPRVRLNAISLSGQTRVALRLIFNQFWDGCQYGLKVVLFGDGGKREHVYALSSMKLRNGHADVEINEDFTFLPCDFRPLAMAGGTSPAVYYYVVLRTPGSPEDDWRAISLAHGWFLAR